MAVKDLLEKHTKVIAEARKFNDEVVARGTPMTKDEDAKWAAMNAEADRLKAAADREEFLARSESDLAQRRGATPPGREDVKPGSGGEHSDEETRSLALAGWFAEQRGEIVPEEQVEAARSCGLNLRAKEITLSLLKTPSVRALRAAHLEDQTTKGSRRAADLRIERRDMSAGSNVAGGYLTAPETMVRNLELAMLLHGGIYEQADIIRTATGGDITWPSADDTSNTGEWLPEAGTIGTTSTDPSFGKTRWGAHKVSSKPVKASFELIRDSVFDLPGMLGSMLGERIGRAKSTAFATGSGAGRPLGLTLSTTLGVTAASATVVTTDEILDLIHSVGRAYRGPGCGFVMADASVLHFRKKKDSAGQYIWQPGLVAGAPDTLFNYPIYTCDDMPAIATGNKSIVFGQLKAYKVREVGSIRLYRLGELYRANDQDGFVAFHECDGGLLDAGQHPVKHLIQA